MNLFEPFRITNIKKTVYEWHESGIETQTPFPVNDKFLEWMLNLAPFPRIYAVREDNKISTISGGKYLNSAYLFMQSQGQTVNGRLLERWHCRRIEETEVTVTIFENMGYLEAFNLLSYLELNYASG